MRFFVAAALEHLKTQSGDNGKSIWDSQLLKVLCVHSDNASQHFKSSKSLHWLSKQILEMGFMSVLWDFGAPGHGKVHNYTPVFLLCSLLLPVSIEIARHVIQN